LCLNSQLILEYIQLDSNGNSKICYFKACVNYNLKVKNNQFQESDTGTVHGGWGDINNDEYQPPEIFINNRIDHSADFWALGISIYKMLTGNFPFLNIESIENGEIPYLQQLEISDEAKEFIRNLLNKNQFERLGSRKNPNHVKNASFFNEIIWEKIEKCEIDPPFKPIVVIEFKKI
jgi:serine/threonine protein kinase